MKKLFLYSIFAILFLVLGAWLYDINQKAGRTQETVELQKNISTLQAEVADLKSSKQTQDRDVQVSQKAEEQIPPDPTLEALKNIAESMGAADMWKKLKCTPVSRMDCEVGKCEQANPTVYLILDRENEVYSRCDSKGCDTYPAQFGSSGLLTNIQSARPIGAMVKVLGDSEYLEIATIGLASLISNGVCEETL